MAWLSGWAANKRFKIDIDYTKIDATLSNFPDMIRLSASSGPNLRDVSAIFDELIAEQVLIQSDTTDGNTTFVDRAKGWPITSGGNVHHEVDQAKWGATSIYFDGVTDYLDLPAAAGDFGDDDFTIEFWTYYDGAPADNFVDLMGNWSSTTDRGWLIGIDNQGAGDDGKMVFAWTTDGSTQNLTTYSSSILPVNAWTHVVVERYAGNVKIYFDAVEKATGSISTNTIYTSSNPLRIGCRASILDFEYKGYLDDIRIILGRAKYQGSVTVPTKMFDLARTQIALTTSDELTQCYVEVERWDGANEIAILHAKVPSVSQSANTALYLYYDSTHAENTTYVGDIGSTPGQTVWNANFELVCHCANDPSGGAGAIKDSTSNGRHGTSQGTMLTGDLVNALVGAKGLDFDGSNDAIAFPFNFLIAETEVTFEAIWKAAAEKATEERIFAYCDQSDLFAMHRLNAGGTAGRILSYFQTNFGAHAIQSDAFTLTDYHYYALGAKENVTADLWVDTAEVGEDVNATTFVGVAGEGHHIGASRTPDTWANGIMSEYRISNIYRSDAWKKATRHSLFDNLHDFTASPGGPAGGASAGVLNSAIFGGSIVR